MLETITSDIVIEIQESKSYICNNDNIQKGKALRPLMESLGWEYIGEIAKTVHGHTTTVAKYQRGN